MQVLKLFLVIYIDVINSATEENIMAGFFTLLALLGIIVILQTLLNFWMDWRVPWNFLNISGLENKHTRPWNVLKIALGAGN